MSEIKTHYRIKASYLDGLIVRVDERFDNYNLAYIRAVKLHQAKFKDVSIEKVSSEIVCDTNTLIKLYGG